MPQGLRSSPLPICVLLMCKAANLNKPELRLLIGENFRERTIFNGH